MKRSALASTLLIVGFAAASGVAKPQTPADAQTPAVQQASPSLSQTAADDPCTKAVPELRSALASNPNDAVTHNKLGVCYQHAKRLSEAIKEYKRAVKLNPRYAEAWNNLGSAYHGQGKLKDAVRQYRKAIDIKPEMAIAHKNEGVALFAMGKIDEGIAAYQRAYALNPAIFGSASGLSFSAAGNSQAMEYYYFAKISAAGGKIDEAFEYLKKALALGFRDLDRVRTDRDFKALVSDPRFADLVKQPRI